MVPNRLVVAAFAALSSLILVDASPCRPSVATTSAIESLSSTISHEISAGSLTTSDASSLTTEREATITTTDSTTATTEIEGATTTTTAASETSTIPLSSQATISTETSTIASDAKTSTTEAEGATTTTAEDETSTVATSIETTTTIATTEGLTTVTGRTTATTTTAEGEPTYLTNLSFDDGTTAPWVATPYSNPLSLSSQSFQGPASGRQVFGSGSGTAYVNYFYQKLDKSLLKPGQYSLKGYVRVDAAFSDDVMNACGSVSAGCLAGTPGNFQNVAGGSGVSANGATDWYLLQVACDFDEQILSQYDQFGVGFGFYCFNSGGNLDGVSFGPV
ncbi:hypothetical protein FPANT_3936 [Fusarium pseudoanthophilum]|uniref:Uncharacterized protein n=1 Tax=Fusarium pseudoanthophilum TaxID=48495 RepID=A0A8H5PKG3_9HYPO|nr:hypothetical protein FPANT_3936 [Fusarium pseudoanthophilum]